MNVFAPNSVTQYHFWTNVQLGQLEPSVKEKIYIEANLDFDFGLVKTFRELGVKSDREITLCPVQSPAILSPYMDIFIAREKIREFFRNLRATKSFLTKGEFSKLDRSKYIPKGTQLDRILGKNYIEERIRALGLKTIKVPQKIAVVESAERHIRITVDRGLGLGTVDLEIYAQRIEPVFRIPTREEMSELFTLLHDTGYVDPDSGNFVIGADGIYIIDTKGMNCGKLYPSYLNRDWSHWVKPEDREWLEQELVARKMLYESQKKSKEDLAKKTAAVFENAMKRYGYFHRFDQGKQFIFQASEFLN